MPSKRTRVAVEPGIRRDRFGFEVYFKYRGKSKCQRFPLATPLRVMREWRTKSVMRLCEKRGVDALAAKCPQTLVMPRSPAGWCYLYVARIGDGESVKIGVAVNPRERLANIQTTSPTPVTMLAAVPAHAALEAAAHQRFAQSRLSGEWFKLTPELEWFIRELQDGRNPVALLWNEMRDIHPPKKRSAAPRGQGGARDIVNGTADVPLGRASVGMQQ